MCIRDIYWADHRRDILPIVDGSFLEEYDEYTIEVQFKSTAAVSITYALMSRCGLEPEPVSYTHLSGAGGAAAAVRGGPAL